jgi:hypothetical protein
MESSDQCRYTPPASGIFILTGKAGAGIDGYQSAGSRHQAEEDCHIDLGQAKFPARKAACFFWAAIHLYANAQLAGVFEVRSMFGSLS